MLRLLSAMEHLQITMTQITKRLVPSRENYQGSSLAALGVAAHEAGHAIQHKQEYALLNHVSYQSLDSHHNFTYDYVGGFFGFGPITTVIGSSS